VHDAEPDQLTAAACADADPTAARNAAAIPTTVACRAPTDSMIPLAAGAGKTRDTLRAVPSVIGREDELRGVEAFLASPGGAAALVVLGERGSATPPSGRRPSA